MLDPGYYHRDCGYYDQETPLFAAVHRCDSQSAGDIVNLLLAAGANPNTGGLTEHSNSGGCLATPLLMAIGMGQEDVVKILIKKMENLLVQA